MSSFSTEKASLRACRSPSYTKRRLAEYILLSSSPITFAISSRSSMNRLMTFLTGALGLSSLLKRK